ncbi:hypothetical protein CRG98_007118 [Punica granatum]|uniref:Uncharacterized protein n=1 Tax=Punica granatum TaxID=22663 RepID=A0A2I0KVL9_PUNGR|nr:hypothetical protein CRG98_007118 [Punica granatum]
MPHSFSCPRLDGVTPPLEEIARIWTALHPVDRHYIAAFGGDIPLLATRRVDWNFLEAAITFWNLSRAVFDIQATHEDLADSPQDKDDDPSGAPPTPSVAIQAELANLRAERGYLHREIAEIDEQLVDQRQLQKELAQTCTELQRRDQELARTTAALERSRKRARGGPHAS